MRVVEIVTAPERPGCGDYRWQPTPSPSGWGRRVSERGATRDEKRSWVQMRLPVDHRQRAGVVSPRLARREQSSVEGRSACMTKL
jgi:hypothetical protein